ncbi:MAG: hypothetical protein F3745_01990 [Nitrospinae bacterium]|nr:hypothetical protein [Nitrospinota bacterium]
MKKQSQSLNEEIEGVFKPWPGQLKTWKKTEGTALLPRLKDFIHDVKGSSLPKFNKDKCLEFLERKSFDLEDYVQDVYNLLSDSEHLKAHLLPNPKLVSHLDYLKRLTDKNREKNNLDYFDMSLVLRLIHLKNGGLPDGTGGVMTLDHLVVDEAQDFGPVEFAIMTSAVSDKRQMTIVGDVAQKILQARKFIGWNKVVENLGMEEDSIIRLEVSFRCTVPIMNLAHKVAGDPKKVEGRAGSDPEWKKSDDRESMLEHLVEWSNRLVTVDPNKLIAIICRYPKQAMELKEELEEYLSGEVRLGHRDQFSFEPGIMVTNIHQVKGLEFDSVVLVEPDEENYPIRREESRNMIYVGITRTQDDLLLTTVKPFSRVFFYN